MRISKRWPCTCEGKSSSGKDSGSFSGSGASPGGVIVLIRKKKPSAVKLRKRASFSREQDDIFVGSVLGVRDIISFHAASVGELKSQLAIAIEDYLSDCKTRGISAAKRHRAK